MPRSGSQGMPATKSPISARISRARPAMLPQSTPGSRCKRAAKASASQFCRAGELTVTVRGLGRGGPNQEYALALAGLLKDTPGIFGVGGGHRWRGWRRRQRIRSRRRDDRSNHICKDEIARPRPQGLSGQQRRHGVFRCHRRSAADRPDADQRQRRPGDPGGLGRHPHPHHCERGEAIHCAAKKV